MASYRNLWVTNIAAFLLVLVVLVCGWIYGSQATVSANIPANDIVASSPDRLLGAAETQDANDLLVLRFDNSLNGENGETPTTATGTSFQAGVQNQGVLLPNPNQLFYTAAGNINASEGSFECWLKPTWNGNDGQHHFILQYGVGGGILIGKDGANNMRIILNRFGAAPGGEVGVAFNIGSWVANQWHHIAFTWSNTSKQLAVYIDGTLKSQNSFTINLPSISSTTFQIGGDGASAYVQAVVDNLRISNVARTPQEISNRMLEGLTVSSWSLNPATSSVELWPTWYWWITPTITANTNIGILSLPVLAANWESSNPLIAILETATGRFKALAPGTAVLTGTLNGTQNGFTINVVAPVLPPVEETIEPFMATPAVGHLYRMPVAIIRYFPTRDGVNLDPTETGITTTLATLKANVEQIERRHKFMLEEGSKFRGYGNVAAAASLGYQVVKIITVYEDIPLGLSAGGNAYFPDYNQILARFDGANLVNNLGVKEIWIVQQHHGRVGINESNMSSPTTGDISNSFRTNGDQPIYNRTYVTYGINYTRSQAEATHNHGHQLEAILSHVNQLRDGNTTLWWGLFARAANNPPARCGNTHFPPNATQDYDYTNLNLVASDILNWQPAGGTTTLVNANTWGNVPYAWPGGTSPPQEVESKWYIFWFQSFAGWGNTIPFNSGKLTNWWAFTGDWDKSIQAGIGLHEPANCNYVLSATSQNMAAAGGPVNVNVTCPGGCKWFASSNETWLTLASDGIGNGNGAVTVSVAANTGNTRSGTVAIAGQLFTINQGGNCSPITISPNTLTPGTAGTPYPTTQLMASGGVTPYAFTLESGALPTGITMDGAGLITGTPTVFGTFNFTVRATDSSTTCFGEQAYSLVINPPCGTITVSPSSMPNGFVSVAYPTQTLSATGGTPNYTFTVSAGSLPNGLNLVGNSISGTPTLAGIYNFTIKATDANGCMGTRAYTVVISGSGPNSLMFYPLAAPVRLLDTRTGEPACFTPGAPVNGGTSLTQLARGTCGIPAAARAVTGNVTVVTPPAGGYLTIYPSDATQPLVANTNYAAGEILNNVFTVGLGNADGSLKIFAQTTSHVVMDITGYYAPPATGGLYFHPLPSPIRLLETRPSEPGCFTPGAPIAGNTEFTQQGTGTCGAVTIPASALALVGNATTVSPVGAGFLTFFPANATRPLIASGNYDAGEILNSPFTVGLSPTGQFKIYALTTTHLVVDVLGYFSPDAVDANGTGLLFNSLTPTRLLDTRPSEPGCFTPGTPLNGGSETSQAARGVCTIASTAQAIVGNVTVVLPASGGFLTFWPSNVTPRPGIATSNYAAGSIFNRYYTVGLGTDGAFKMFAQTTTHVVVDVSGYFAP